MANLSLKHKRSSRFWIAAFFMVMAFLKRFLSSMADPFVGGNILKDWSKAQHSSEFKYHSLFIKCVSSPRPWLPKTRCRVLFCGSLYHAESDRAVPLPKARNSPGW